MEKKDLIERHGPSQCNIVLNTGKDNIHIGIKSYVKTTLMCEEEKFKGLCIFDKYFGCYLNY